MTIGMRLRELMDENNVTYQNISNFTGLSINTLSLLATGKSRGIQFNTLEKLLVFFECEIEDLFYYNISEEDKRNKLIRNLEFARQEIDKQLEDLKK